MPSFRNIINEADLQSQNSHYILSCFLIVFSKLLLSAKVNGNHINLQRSERIKVLKGYGRCLLLKAHLPIFFFNYSEFGHIAYLKCSLSYSKTAF